MQRSGPAALPAAPERRSDVWPSRTPQEKAVNNVFGSHI
jgi:hypothetical protein